MSLHRSDACPICGKAAAVAQTPFCSQGCRDRDLLRWLSDGYRIPVEDDSAQDGLDSVPSPLL